MRTRWWPCLMLGALLGCAPEVAGVRERTGPPRPEEHDIVPVGGYEPLAGQWATTRRDEVIGEQQVPLIIEVDKDVLIGAAPDHAVRVRCQASHRTCVGRWSDNVGSGRMTWVFAPDFRSFQGSYDGTSEGRDVGRSSWTGVKQ
ncbi:MAG: hypothetical protein RMK29_18520 [Myxococcales bacterium]|nr:hypothetical protein [Myxococcales bacterium]